MELNTRGLLSATGWNEAAQSCLWFILLKPQQFASANNVYILYLNETLHVLSRAAQ